MKNDILSTTKTVGKDERSFISREEYDALLAENAELNKKLDYLMGQLRLLKQKTFGVSSCLLYTSPSPRDA